MSLVLLILAPEARREHFNRSPWRGLTSLLAPAFRAPKRPFTLGVLVRNAVFEELGFSSPVIGAYLLRGADKHRITRRSTVINLSRTDAWTGDTQESPLPPFSSTIITNAHVSGELILLLDETNTEAIEKDFRDLAWADFYGGSDDSPVLLRSPQVDIGRLELNENEVLRRTAASASGASFLLKANLWFSPAGTDCGLHNQHDFIEIHTQVSGYGRMQKFSEKDHGSLYEDQLLSPGNTNPVPFCTEQDGRYAYPWHQYRADTDCVWLALEYHRL